MKLSLNAASLFYIISIIIGNRVMTHNSRAFAHVTRNVQLAEMPPQYNYITYNLHINIDVYMNSE